MITGLGSGRIPGASVLGQVGQLLLQLRMRLQHRSVQLSFHLLAPGPFFWGWNMRLEGCYLKDVTEGLLG